MTGKDKDYQSPTRQALFRLALSLCAARILLDLSANTALQSPVFALLSILLLYPVIGYFTLGTSLSFALRQRLALILRPSDGLIVGSLAAVVSFDSIVTLGLGLILCTAIMGSQNRYFIWALPGVAVGISLTVALRIGTVVPSSNVQLMILIVAAVVCLLQINIFRRRLQVVNGLHDALVLENGWLTLRNFRLFGSLSPPLRNAVLSGKKLSVGSQQKPLTIFFSDMKRFTQLTEELDSAQLIKVMSSYFNTMSAIVSRYGGTIDKMMGDGLMVFFGDPGSHGIRIDAINCVSMAIAMKRAMINLQKRWRAEGIQAAPTLRIGINSGVCEVGNFGNENRLDYTLLGRSVNLASRLETAAQSDEILISSDTYQLIKDAVYCVSKGPLLIKGLAEPVNVYLVVDLHRSIEADQLHPLKHATR